MWINSYSKSFCKIRDELTKQFYLVKPAERLTEQRTHQQKYSTILSRIFCISAICDVLFLKRFQMPHFHTQANFEICRWRGLEIIQIGCRILRKVQIPNIWKVVFAHEIQPDTVTKTCWESAPQNYISWHLAKSKALAHLKFIYVTILQ